jgi:hypothetical protein
VIVELIAATQGLKVRAELDRGSYPLGVKILDRALAVMPLQRHDWHGECNYTVLPAAAWRSGRNAIPARIDGRSGSLIGWRHPMLLPWARFGAPLAPCRSYGLPFSLTE